MNYEVKTTPEELNDNSPDASPLRDHYAKPGVNFYVNTPVQLKNNLSGKHFLNRNARSFRKVGIPRPDKKLSGHPLCPV